MIIHPEHYVNVIAGDMAGTVRPQSLEAVAEQFEAMFLRTMLSEMRKSTDVLSTENGIFNSREARTMRDFYDSALAQELASQRSTGVADLLVKQLTSKARSA
ncbi:rod-binding protein [Enterobacteriaceae bacterium LUAb1]